MCSKKLERAEKAKLQKPVDLFFWNFAVWLGFVNEKELMRRELRRGKNIFKKVAKIPPGELQDAPLVIKWSDETDSSVVICERAKIAGSSALRATYCVLREGQDATIQFECGVRSFQAGNRGGGKEQ